MPSTMFNTYKTGLRIWTRWKKKSTSVCQHFGVKRTLKSSKEFLICSFLLSHNSIFIFFNKFFFSLNTNRTFSSLFSFRFRFSILMFQVHKLIMWSTLHMNILRWALFFQKFVCTFCCFLVHAYASVMLFNA